MTNILFSTPNCPWCDCAKDFLNANGIEFEEIKVDSVDKFAYMQSYVPGIRTAPVLMVGKVVLAGYPAITAHFNPKV